MASEIFTPVLNMLAVHEPSHGSPRFSINDTSDVTDNLNSVTAAIQDPKYHVSNNKPVILVRRFMKEHNVDYVKDSYLEDIQFTQDETTDASLKLRLLYLRLQGATMQKIQQSLTLHRKMLKEGSSDFERNKIQQ